MRRYILLVAVYLFINFLFNLPIQAVHDVKSVSINDELDDHDEDDNETPYEDLVKNLGKLAMILGSASFTWYFMKSKIKSKVKIVRKISKWFYSFHVFFAWSALILVIAHGFYFVWFKWGDDETITGLLALLFLLALIVLGIRLQFKRSSSARKVHFIFSIIWIISTVIHASDVIPLALFTVLCSFGIVWYIEKRSQQSTLKSSS